jgi:arylsulfatase
MEGRSLLPAFANQSITRDHPLFFEHEGSRAVRDGKWKLVSLSGDAWELYDLEADPAEMTNLILREPAKARQLSINWQAWATRCNVDVQPERLPAAGAPATTQIANQPLRISCDVDPESRNGVILAQGGRQNGYALHLEDGHVVFSVRIREQLFVAKAPAALEGRFSLEAVLARDGAMHLSINGREVATAKGPGLIPVQPIDDLSIGEDSRTAVGDYTPPNPLAGKVENVKIRSGL